MWKVKLTQTLNSPSPFVPLSHSVRWAIIGVIATIAVGIGIANISHYSTNSASVYFAFLVLLSVLALPLFTYRRHWGLFHPIIFCVLWVGLFSEVLRPLPVYAIGLDFHLAVPGATLEQLNAVVAKSLLLTSLGFVALYLGYFVAPPFPVAKVTFAEPRFLLAKVLIITAISTFALFVLVQEAGGLGRLMLQRGLSRDMRVGAELGGHWSVVVGLLRTTCLVWLALRPSVWKHPTFVMFFAFSLFIVFAATGSRGGIIMPIIWAAAIWSLQYGRIPYGRGVVIAMVGVVALGVLGEFRSQSRGAESLADIQIESGIIDGTVQGVDTLTGYAGPVSGLYGIVARVPQDVGLLYGESYLSVPAAPIPSALWPDKPSAGGRLTGWHIFNRGDSGGGVPPGNIGEAYWNFHVPGVVAVMLVFGGFLQWFARFYRENARDGGVVAVFVVTLFALQPNSVSFYGWLHNIIAAVLLLVMFCGVPRFSRAGVDTSPIDATTFRSGRERRSSRMISGR